MLESLVLAVERFGHGPVGTALLMGLLVTAMTGLGGSLVVLLRGRARGEGLPLLVDMGLGFSSGVMIVASFTSLLLPAIDRYGLPLPLAGLVLGALLIHAVNKLVPHEHFLRGFEGPEEARGKLRAAWLVALAIIIHNIPEGLSIGAASAYSPRDAVALGLAIGLQDVPEGLAVSLPAYASTARLGYALALAWLSGLSELLAAVPTALVAGIRGMLPLVMGLGAGAMVYVVSHEAIPETHRTGNEDKATLSFFLGFIVMLVLDTALG